MARARESTTTNQPSSLLSAQENNAVYEIIGSKCKILATAVVEVYLCPPEQSEWQKECEGVACFVKDYANRCYLIKIVDLMKKAVVWEKCILQGKYNVQSQCFHSCELEDCLVGFDFVHWDDASNFGKVAVERLSRKVSNDYAHFDSLDDYAHFDSLELLTKELHILNHEHPLKLTHRKKWHCDICKTKSVNAKSYCCVDCDYDACLACAYDIKKATKKTGKIMKDEKIDTLSASSYFADCDRKGGFDVENIVHQWKKLFDIVGIGEDQLQDESTFQFIYDMVDQHGGIEKAIKEIGGTSSGSAKVLFPYAAQLPNQLTLSVGDIVTSIKEGECGWSEGELHGKRGSFPQNYVSKFKPDEPKIIFKADVKYDYEPNKDGELALKQGTTIEVVDATDEGWWTGLYNGKIGIFPSNYIEVKKESKTSELIATTLEYAGSFKVLYAYSAEQPNELTLSAGDIVTNIKEDMNGWCEGELKGKRGFFPQRFVFRMKPGEEDIIFRAEVKYDYEPNTDGELALKQGTTIEVVDATVEGWWTGLYNGKVGIFPSNYIEVKKDSISSDDSIFTELEYVGFENQVGDTVKHLNTMQHTLLNPSSLGVQELCQCPICFEIMDNPKSLQCEHAYCKDCIEEVVQFDDDGNPVIKCPVCNSKQYLEKGTTIGSLKATLLLKQLLDMLPRNEVDSDVGNIPQCCNMTVSWYCGQCGLYLCKECIERHSSRGCIGCIQVKYCKSKDEMIPFCNIHSSFKFYSCISCAEVICPYCKANNHHKHRIISLNEYRLIFQGYLVTKVKICEEYFDSVKDTLNNPSTYQTAIDSAKTLISKGNVEIIWHTQTIMNMMSGILPEQDEDSGCAIPY